MNENEIKVQSCIDCQYRSPVEIAANAIFCRSDRWERINHYLNYKCGKFVEGDPMIIVGTDIQILLDAGVEVPSEWTKASKGFVFNKAGARIYRDRVVEPKVKSSMTNTVESTTEHKETEYVVEVADKDLKITEAEFVPAPPEVVDKMMTEIKRNQKGYKIVKKEDVKATATASK